MRQLLLALLFLAAVAPAQGLPAPDTLSNPVEEARARGKRARAAMEE